MQIDYQYIGMGTYRLKDMECVNMVSLALQNGYKLIDTAMLYKNQSAVAQGITNSGVDRHNVYITSKILKKNMDKLKISESIDTIMKELQTEYMDLILLHVPSFNYAECWQELIRCKEHYNIKNIGVSNFTVDQMTHIYNLTGVQPYLNQIEYSVFFQQKPVVEYAKNNNIIVQGHSTLCNKTKFDDEKLNAISTKYNVPIDKLMLQFALQNDVGIIPMTSNYEHLLSNLTFDKLDTNIMNELYDLDCDYHLYNFNFS